MSTTDLAKVLSDHELWLESEGGSRADLAGAGLEGADLARADPVSYTHLTLPTM
jgi:hypothetical protein